MTDADQTPPEGERALIVDFVHVGRWTKCAHCQGIFAGEHYCGAPWQARPRDMPDNWQPQPKGERSLMEVITATKALPIEHLIRRYGLPDDDLVSRSGVLDLLARVAAPAPPRFGMLHADLIYGIRSYHVERPIGGTAEWERIVQVVDGAAPPAAGGLDRRVCEAALLWLDRCGLDVSDTERAELQRDLIAAVEAARPAPALNTPCVTCGCLPNEAPHWPMCSYKPTPRGPAGGET
jgi:hypothetical protein